ncbi:MAG: hypothetical protein GY931_16820 [Maribacter sp.]|nr:hypothetical protein [Maribacter sp.]
MGSTTTRSSKPELEIITKGQYALEKVGILRNSIVIKTFDVKGYKEELTLSYLDNDYNSEQGVLYYYIRVTQINKAIA